MTNKVGTEYIDLVGKIYWAKVYEPDMFMGQSNYKIDLFPQTEEEWEKFKKSGIQKTVKENEFGKYFQLVRPSLKVIKGAVVNFTPPILIDKDKNVLVEYVDKNNGNRVLSYDAKDKDKIERRGQPLTIGNGSLVSVNVSVYDTQKGRGHRFNSVQILDLIEYKREEAAVDTETVLNDEIPDFTNTPKGKKAPW